MGRPTMRRLALLLLAVSAVLVLPAPSAPAQEPAAVRLTMLSQTPWNSTDARLLEVRFRAENLGDVPIGELSIGVTLYGRVISRTALEESLVTDPGFVVDAETFAREGTLDPGVGRDFEIGFTLDSPGIDPDQSGVYPLKIELRSGFTSLAALRSPVVFLVRQPEVPLALSWTFVLDHPIAFGPDGVFTSTALEESLAPGGRLAAQIRALEELATQPPQPAVDVAVSPLLLMQLERMRDGYGILEDGDVRVVTAGEGASGLAEVALENLSRIVAAPNVRVTALPFSDAELPALIAGGLGRDLPIQLERGRDVVATVLEVTPSSTVLRPPGAAVDDASLRELAEDGVGTVIVAPGTVVPSPQPLGFAGPPTAAIGEGGAVDAIVPEPAVATLLQEGLVDEDPIRAAQVVLGELASIWQERPGEARGIAVVLSEDAALPPAFFVPFARAVAGAPWLRPMHAAELAAAFPAIEPTPLAPAILRSFGTSYVEELKQARRLVATYRSMLVDESEVPERLETLLLLAEARQFLSNPTDGQSFIATVRDAVEAVFASVSLQETVQEITLTSSSGSGIPVTVSNGSDEALRLTLRLVSENLRETETSELELAPGASETVRFNVELKTTGRFRVQVQVVSPGGRVIAERTIDVRSTAYNRIALIITAVAALALLLLWARRFLPRRTS